MEDESKKGEKTIEELKSELESVIHERDELQSAHNKLKDDFIALSLCKQNEPEKAKKDDFNEFCKSRLGKK